MSKRVGVEIWEEIKVALSPIFIKRTRGGWIVFGTLVLFFLSDKFDSINSMFSKVKSMGEVSRVVIESLQSPGIQVVLFFAGCAWIGIACYLGPKEYFPSEERLRELQKARREALAEDEPKNRIAVRSGRDVEGCTVRDTKGTWYRARLDVTGASVSSLEASIIGLWEDGVKLDLQGEVHVMSMCRCEREEQPLPQIRERRPEYINLLFAAHDSEKPPVLSLKRYLWSLGDLAYFKLLHEYQMDVILNCDDTHPSVPFSVKLKLKSNDVAEKFELV
jgi:hypothetical protein